MAISRNMMRSFVRRTRDPRALHAHKRIERPGLAAFLLADLLEQGMHGREDLVQVSAQLEEAAIFPADQRAQPIDCAVALLNGANVPAPAHGRHDNRPCA
jgi:hypothetical protein